MAEHLKDVKVHLGAAGGGDTPLVWVRRLESLCTALGRPNGTIAGVELAGAAAAPSDAPSPTPGSSDAWAEAAQRRLTIGDASGLSDSQVDEFFSRGMVALPLEQIGLPAEWHRRLLSTALERGGAAGFELCEHLPFEELLTAPGVEAGVASLLGPDWAVMPFSNGGGNNASRSFVQKADQHWHCGAQ